MSTTVFKKCFVATANIIPPFIVITLVVEYNSVKFTQRENMSNTCRYKE
ncbi:MAG: hypothetical protein BWY15_02411 [Firmicutes bacterium ADurb.Bin193]|nr:MAG: hypothetical protein BWY15_02411 [Firmicutes bacterium ADurb.Bin193]